MKVRTRPELRAVALGRHVHERHEDVDEAARAVRVKGLAAGAWP